MQLIMDFLLEFGLFALLIVIIMAFMGVATSKLAGAFGGKTKDEAYEKSQQTKNGWKAVGGSKKE